MTGSAVVAALALGWPASTPAQEAKAGVVTTVQGTATVARATATEPAPLRFRDDVFVHDRITTGEESVARILLGGKAVVTVRERSELVITESATTSTLAVSHGKIALAVNKARMRPGESVEIRTPNAVAGIRGTVIIAEVTPGPTAATVASTFTLLTGIVDVTLLDPAGQPSASRLTLKPMQVVAVNGFSALGVPRDISRPEAASVAADYRVNFKDPVAPQVIDRQVNEAAKRSAAAVTSIGAGIRNVKPTDSATDGPTAGSLRGTGGSPTSGGSLVGGTVGTVGGSLTSGGSLVGGTVGSLGGGATSGGLLGGSSSPIGAAIGGGIGGGITNGGAIGTAVGGGGIGGGVGGGRLTGDGLRNLLPK